MSEWGKYLVKTTFKIIEKMKIQEGKYQIKRYDLSEDKSLRGWNAADEYLLKTYVSMGISPNHLCIYNDRFGFLSSHFHSYDPIVILTHKSQEKSIQSNLEAHNLPLVNFSNPLSPLENKLDSAIIKIPKSLALFQLFLEHIVDNSTEDVTILCGFMTRHFTPKLLEIAQEYFNVVEQSRALKKSRILVLSKKKEVIKRETIISLDYNNQAYRQYWGVFSSNHIDYATQFFLTHIELKSTDKCILDLASGNGIIGNEIFIQLPDSEIHLMDDAYLAISSAKLNIQGESIHHHLNDNLSIFADEYFDLIVSNPPFHFEYEINIQVPIQLFKECFRCLKKGGSFQLVANRHLNHKVHLKQIFNSVQIVSENSKFVVYKCIKE